MAYRRRFRARFNKKVNVSRVISKIAGTILALWAGGFVINILGDVMTCTGSPFYKGVQLIGWTVTSSHQLLANGTVTGSNGLVSTCNLTSSPQGTVGETYNMISSTNGAGILAVVGIIGVATIVMEFVDFRLK